MRLVTRSAFCVVASLLIASAASSQNIYPSAPHIYVEGSAETRVEPDMLTVSVDIHATDPNLDTAKASVDERARKLIESCKKLGVKDDDITSTGLQIGPEYDYSSRPATLLGTRVSRQIEVTLRKLDRYSELVQSLVAARIGEIQSTTATSSKAEKILEEVQQRAIADARARADRLAAASGQVVGAAYSISEFNARRDAEWMLTPSRHIGKPSVRGSTETEYMAGTPPEPFEPGTIVATATVYVVYLLEPK